MEVPTARAGSSPACGSDFYAGSQMVKAAVQENPDGGIRKPRTSGQLNSAWCHERLRMGEQEKPTGVIRGVSGARVADNSEALLIECRWGFESLPACYLKEDVDEGEVQELRSVC